VTCCLMFSSLIKNNMVWVEQGHKATDAASLTPLAAFSHHHMHQQ